MKAFVQSQKIVTTLFFAVCMLTLHAQDMPTRYATLEHFTNTPCPSCGSQNPGFFSLLENYSGQYHHISYHPGRPYQSCIFYQANPDENRARTTYYDIFSSPRVVINGLDQIHSGGVNATMMDAATGGESPIEVRVTESSGFSRTVNIDVNVFGTPPVTDAKLYAAVVEKEIMYNAPNGETVHHNVFRKFLSDDDGDDIDISQSVTGITFNYNVDGSWDADQIYTVVWIQNPTNKEVLNSGTKYDPPFVSAVSEINKINIDIYPNPVTNYLNIIVPSDLSIDNVQVHDQKGRRTLNASTDQTNRIDVHKLASGIYFLEISFSNGDLVRDRFVKY